MTIPAWVFLVFAIIVSMLALGVSFMVFMANGMRSSSGDFEGGSYLVGAWIFAAVWWALWFFTK